MCEQVAHERGLAVQSPFEEYLRTGKFRVAGTNAFQIDVFANLQELVANFDPIDHLVAKLLLLADLSVDETLAAKVVGRTCPRCGAKANPAATSCAACGTSLP